jgi:hypothetical protein
MRILFPVLVKASFTWDQSSYAFVRDRYPLEWRKATALCPELDEIADEE